MTGQQLVFWKVTKRPTCGASRSPGWGVLRTESVTWKTPRDYRVWEFMLSCVQPFATLWIVAHQAPLWDSPGKNTGMGCHALLQWIFLSQGSNPHLVWLLHWQADSLLQSHQESPETIMEMSNLPHSQPLVAESRPLWRKVWEYPSQWLWLIFSFQVHTRVIKDKPAQFSLQ